MQLARILACTLCFAGGRGGNAFMVQPQQAACGVVLPGRQALGGDVCSSMSTPSMLVLARRQPTGRTIQVLSPSSHPLLLRRAAETHDAVLTALGGEKGETRGEAKKSGTLYRRGRQGSGSIPYVNAPGEPNLRAVYISQMLSGFADRMWEFSIPFFLLALNRPDSMLLAIFYALVSGVANVAGGPVIGYAVEKYPRLKTVNVCIMLQTVLVLVSFIAMRTALSLSASSGGTIAALVVILTLSSSAASLTSLASTHAIERDWIKCLNLYEVALSLSSPPCLSL